MITIENTVSARIESLLFSATICVLLFPCISPPPLFYIDNKKAHATNELSVECAQHPKHLKTARITLKKQKGI